MAGRIARLDAAAVLKCMALLACPLLGATSLHAALPLGRSEVVFQLTGSGETILRGTGSLRQPYSDSYTNSAGASWGGAVLAETGEESGRRFATASASSVTLGAANANAPGEATVSATLDYQLLLYQLAPPPIPLAVVPGRVQVQAWASATALGDPASNAGYSSAAVTIDGAPPTFVEALGSEGSSRQDFDQSLTVFYVPGTPLDVRLRAGATAHSGLNLGGPTATNARAAAFADPIFSLDQAAFDDMAAEQGFATFDLGSYFAFEQSALAPVPEPASVVLMLAGMALLAGAYRRRQAGGHDSLGGSRSELRRP